MRAIVTIFFAGLTAMTMSMTTACSNDSLLGKYEALGDELCACKDAKCVAEVQKKLEALKDGAKEPSDDDKKKAKVITKKIRGCMEGLFEKGLMPQKVAPKTAPKTDSKVAPATK